MGRQFSFFLTQHDAALFEEALLADGQTVLLASRPPFPVPLQLGTSIRPEKCDDWLGILLARAADLDQIVFEPIPTRADYTTDVLTQPIIEFDRCYIENDLIRCGRLYLTSSYFNGQRHLVQKPSAFLEWATSLFRRGKKALTHLGSGYYAGPEAAKLYSEGLKFETGAQGLQFEGGKLTGVY